MVIYYLSIYKKNTLQNLQLWAPSIEQLITILTQKKKFSTLMQSTARFVASVQIPTRTQFGYIGRLRSGKSERASKECWGFKATLFGNVQDFFFLFFCKRTTDFRIWSVEILELVALHLFRNIGGTVCIRGKKYSTISKLQVHKPNYFKFLHCHL